ncbi:MAG: adenosylmethionine--8-amino-7-oxononanoate transaminase [Bacteroidetes bacterium]|nr:adenosylmethionine--8-amino-7-oxononanoate transaminase [Bacteroidota bacterium]MBK8681989.1 adenosylmethionine--8-amino-7-oxononanoate transaminase [Bacteroidota bacterium]
MKNNFTLSNKNYIWHPFTQMKTADVPIHIVKGEGALLWDNNDNTYIDAISSWWTNIHGHANPYIAEKMHAQLLQLEHVIFAGFTHTPAETLAERLIENHLPKNQKKVFFSDNGSTAVEVAIKMALQYWFNKGIKKTKIIALENSYHGDTFGSMSVSARSAFTHAFDTMLFDVIHIAPPYAGQEQQCSNALRELLNSDDTIAAIIYEPLVQGSGGMHMYAPDALDMLISICKSKNILCIADEVMTGFYRTGKMFASDYCINKPDIICISKGITGGTMALGLTTCTEEIFNAFYDDDAKKALYHGHSYTGNPLACAAANASLDLCELPAFKKQIETILQMHGDFITTLQHHTKVKNARRAGTILAFEIESSNSDYFSTIKKTLYPAFLKAGVLLRPLGNTIYIMPPYCITEQQLQKVYDVIEKVIG